MEGWLGTDDVVKIISIVANASDQKQIEVGLANMRLNKYNELHN
jgi:hypothetical protein